MKECKILIVILGVLLLILGKSVTDIYMKNKSYRENVMEVEDWKSLTEYDNTIMQAYVHSDYPVPYLLKDGRYYNIVYLCEYVYHFEYKSSIKRSRKVTDKNVSNCSDYIDINGQIFNKQSFLDFKFINLPIDNVGLHKEHYFLPNNYAVFIGNKEGSYYLYFGTDKEKAINDIGSNWRT